MSHGNFDFIGDVYPQLVILSSKASYIASDKSIDDANKDVLTAIDPNVNFSNYDNWKLEDGQFVFSEHNADGYVDMIFICYRGLFNANGWHAWASLGLAAWTVTKDGKNIHNPGAAVSSLSSGLTIQQSVHRDEYTMKQTMIHEFGHFLFGACHTTTGGIMGNTGNVARTFALSGWESERLGYIAYTVANQNGFTVPLGDYINTGNVLKIPIPITNPNSPTFFIVENHQRSSIYDQIVRGGSLGGNWNFTTNLGKGIYIHYITNGNSSCASNDWRTADGSWNWVLDGTFPAPGFYVGKPWEGTVPKTIRSSVNRNTGKSDRKHDNIYWNGAWQPKWCDDYPSGTYSLTRDIMGDEYDAFNIGYNELFTPWSNPSTYSSGTTNISVQLYSQYGNEITVKVFTTYASSLALQPSKPQALKVGLGTNNHPLLTWAANIEPDFNQYKIYKKTTVQGSWQYLAATSSTSYLDVTETYLTGGAQAFQHYIDYRITAVDNQSLESVPSEKVTARVAGAPLDKSFGDVITENIKPTEYSLTQNYPNPFNPVTQINYQVKAEGFVELKVYDILGNEITALVNEVKSEGYYSVQFDASNLPSGVYIYSLRVNDFIQNRKMTLMK
jgi:hypothetical protein